MDVSPEPIGAAPQRSGCLVALYVIFGLALLLLVAGGAAMWLFLQSEEGQTIVEAASLGIDLIGDASEAPGTEELRAAGCETALVPDVSRTMNLISAFLSEEQNAELQQKMEAGLDAEELRLVVCMLPRFGSSAPSCGDLARTYADAVPDTPRGFFLGIWRQGAEEAVCEGRYGSDGVLVEAQGP